MMQFGENAAQTTIFGTARFFDWSARTWTGSDFASAEAPEAQRFYNFLCIAYGGDPIAFYNLKTSGVLPESGELAHTNISRSARRSTCG